MRHRYTWLEEREVKVERKPCLSGSKKVQHMRKVRTWKRRRERRRKA